jgi:hypothetical protein
LRRGAEGPDGAGSANKSGWMTGEDFLLFMEYFTKNCTGVTKERPVLLLRYHQSHFAVKVLDIAKENGAVLLFPFHASHKVQNLDRSVCLSLKKFVNKFRCLLNFKFEV